MSKEVPDMPEKLLRELKKNEKAYDNFLNFPVSIRRIYLQWLAAAKRDETYSRRMSKIIGLSENNIKTSML
jgi:uncharacterized protein YdeI (YjbR/CyaY-like superfamily)